MLIKKCHLCGHLNWKDQEVEQCEKCHKSFLPLNYFKRMQKGVQADTQQLFCQCHELSEEDMVKGLYVLW